jgi:uncharacterized integral membrane protein
MVILVDSNYLRFFFTTVALPLGVFALNALLDLRV